MPNGILGKADLSADTNTTVATTTVPTVLNIRVLNRNASPVVVNIALAATGSPAASEYIEYEAVLEGNSPLDNNGFIVGAGINVVVRSSSANVNAIVFNAEV